MKARNGYVSNSSSSSFVMVTERAVRIMRERKEPLDESYLKELFSREIERADKDNEGKWIGLFENGHKEFGWEIENYYDEETKWNWLVMQAYYGGSEDSRFTDLDYRWRLEEFLDNLLGRKVQIDWDGIAKLENDIDAYIDHQSIDTEETFAMVDRVGITEFLLSNYTFVHTDNDNH